MLSFLNTLSGRVEEFASIEPGKVRMYTCGPTVYHYAHIGNYRTFIFGDVLRRHLRRSGYTLDHVMNITDVDDKTIQNSAKAGLPLAEYTEKFTQAFLEDCKKLRMESPERLVRATHHINEMVAAIQALTEKGCTYTSEGSVYFRIASFPTYGKLSKIDFEGMRAGARVDNDEYDKADARDFVLWKAAKPGEPHWDTPLGPGRPGWHIECSVMANKYLGDTLDIHAGGVDLCFPHHENEIAQSESLTGKTFARYWLHSEHLLVDGQKMSKSLGNFYTLRDLIEKGHKPESIRYLLLSVPHHKQLNFTIEGLKQAATAIERLENFRFRLGSMKFGEGVNAAIETRTSAFAETFTKAMDDDLNTAQALGVMFELVRIVNTAIDADEFRNGNVQPVLDAIKFADGIFDVLAPEEAKGIAPADSNNAMSAEEVDRKLEERRQARANRNFALADQVRKELDEAGILIEDTKDGVRWRRK